MHFEDLWEKCENIHKKSDSENSSAILDELMLKLNLYKVLEQKTDLPQEDNQKIKSRTFGEILFTLTNLSLQENINVFDALNTALQYRLIETFDKKYSD